MNINEIEDNLNNHESDPEKVLDAILNAVAKNQAMLQTLLDSQLMLMKLINPQIDVDGMAKKIDERTATYLAEIQALITSKL